MITADVRKAKNCNGEYSLFLSFPYDNEIIMTIKNLPSRYWDKDKKEWEVPLKKAPELINSLRNYDIKLTGELSAFKKKEPKYKSVDFNFKTAPFDHQVDGFKFGLNHNAWLLGDEQGLGKTKQVIDIAVAKKQKEDIKHCLIVCGVNGLKWNWLNEIKTHSNESGYILGQRTKKNKIVIGSTNDKIEDLKNINAIDDFFLITNVESLRNAEIQTMLGKYCKDGRIDIVAIDEIHKCKNPSSQQGKGILKLQPPYRVAMTGTPLMNTPMDLFIILKWLGYEKHAFYAFKNH